MNIWCRGPTKQNFDSLKKLKTVAKVWVRKERKKKQCYKWKPCNQRCSKNKKCNKNMNNSMSISLETFNRYIMEKYNY